MINKPWRIELGLFLSQMVRWGCSTNNKKVSEMEESSIQLHFYVAAYGEPISVLTRSYRNKNSYMNQVLPSVYIPGVLVVDTLKSFSSF